MSIHTNKLFSFFQKEHALLLTEDEIDEIIYQVKKGDVPYVDQMRSRINIYRTINVLILGALLLILPEYPLKWVVGLFLLYNLLHVLCSLIYFKWWLNAKKRRKMGVKN